MGARFTKEKMQTAKTASSGGGNLVGFNWADLKVDKSNREKQITTRLIGFPYGYKEHSGYKQVINPTTKKKEWVETGFHDDDQYEKRKYTRICTENNPQFGACPWCEAGYRVSQRFAQNILVRTPDKGADGKVRFKSEVAILQKGASLFIKGILAAEEAAALSNEANGYEEDDPDAACTFLGGENAHNVIIKAEFNAKQPNNPDYIVTYLKKDKVSEADIELLAEVGKPTPEELEAIYSDDKDLRQYPEWFTYGYQFQKIYKPTAVKTLQETTAAADLDVEEDTEEEAEVPARRPAKTSTRRPAPVQAASDDDEEEDSFTTPGSAGVEVEEDDLDFVLK